MSTSIGLLKEQLLSPSDLSALTGIAAATLAGWRSQNRGPTFMKFGRRVVYHMSDFEAWMEEQKRGTADQKREVALPIRRTGPVGKRINRFGGYRTKQEKGGEERGCPQGSDSGGPMGDSPTDTASVQ